MCEAYMDGYKTLNVASQMALYKSGWKGGPFNAKPYTPPPMTVVDAVPDSVKEELMSKEGTSMTINDPWVMRRASGN